MDIGLKLPTSLESRGCLIMIGHVKDYLKNFRMS